MAENVYFRMWTLQHCCKGMSTVFNKTRMRIIATSPYSVSKSVDAWAISGTSGNRSSKPMVAYDFLLVF